MPYKHAHVCAWLSSLSLSLALVSHVARAGRAAHVRNVKSAMFLTAKTGQQTRAGAAGGQPHVYVTTTISRAEFTFMKEGQWVAGGGLEGPV